MTVRSAYENLVAGGKGTEPSKAEARRATGPRRVALLVASADLGRGGDDTFAAVGLGRQLARLGLGVRLVARADWYTTTYRSSELLVALVPGVDLRRLPSSVSALAWVRDEAAKWLGVTALDTYAGVLATSELGRDLVARRYHGPLGLLPEGFDEDLCADSYKRPDAQRTAITDDKTNDKTNRGFGRFRRPERYRASALVVERVPGPDVGYGQHGATLFAALACGAPVATNTALGLHELGLDRLPVYRTEREVQRLGERARDGEFADLARELREVVRARHGYPARARALVAFADEHGLWQPPVRSGTTLNFYPDWTRTNPYQRMLYARLPGDVRTLASADAVTIPVAGDDGGDVSDQILHVHWQNYVVQPGRNHADAERRLREATATIEDLLERGLRLVWTIHNRLPHDIDFYFAELEFCRFLAHRAHVIHVLSDETVDAVGGLFDLDPAKIRVVEHGSYVGVYPELLDRATARDRLGLLPSERVVLFFGAVRPYKGLEQLVEVFEQLHFDDPTTRLLVVGQPGRTMPPEFLDRLADLPFVTTHFGFVPDSDVHLYFRAADIQVAPYSAVLNSGSVLLGVGYGLPVVAPNLGALNALADEPFMFAYESGSAAGLARALRAALRSARDPAVTGRAVEYANAYTGDDMSAKFVRDVLGREPAPAQPAHSEKRGRAT